MILKIKKNPSCDLKNMLKKFILKNAHVKITLWDPDKKRSQSGKK